MADAVKIDQLLEKMKTDSKLVELAKNDPAKALESVGVKVAPGALVAWQMIKGPGGEACWIRGAPTIGCLVWEA